MKKKLVVGLGNIGREYDGTPHNAGFLSLDKLAEALGLSFSKKGSWQAEVASGEREGIEWWLIKPSTFMNLSGRALSLALRDKPLALSDLLVLSDDVDLDLGRLRLRLEGGNGGHKGLIDISERLGTRAFPRMKIGVGPRPSGDELADFVLRKMTLKEREKLDEVAKKAAELVLMWGEDPAKAIEAAELFKL